jgi:hypothetical protein
MSQGVMVASPFVRNSLLSVTQTLRKVKQQSGRPRETSLQRTFSPRMGNTEDQRLNVHVRAPTFTHHLYSFRID